MNPTALSMLLASLALGTIITTTSYHWLFAWIGLEINTLAIMPLISKTPHPRAIEAATKYFLTQAAASMLILFSTTLNAWVTGQWAINLQLLPLPTTLLTISLLMKLGLAPLHFWLPEVLQGSNLITGLILSTWQKIAPMALLLQIHQFINLNLMLLIGIISALIGGWGGINETQLRKLLAFSSIAHFGWMTMILKFSPQLSMLNFTLYIIMSSSIFLTLTNLSSTTMLSMSNAWPKAPTLIVLTMMSLLSLGGLPPLSGFTPKWLIINELINQETTALASIMMMSALLSLFFYIRLSYSTTLTLFPNPSFSSNSWSYKQNPTSLIPPLIILSSLLLPMSTTLLHLL
uniref:NADH-ubiquinone oxidoreductase chain 2 n=1 Tax=Sooglossus thomasseti TaxID=8425 RepID=K9JYW6_SOOTH|nr:NADH dehydrogenase subunit 2 [Sooglossus thomasseti]AEC33189.1 NADH dehydrogenase subunit 2 [Sooglossus thomasseti]